MATSFLLVAALVAWVLFAGADSEKAPTNPTVERFAPHDPSAKSKKAAVETLRSSAQSDPEDTRRKSRDREKRTILRQKLPADHGQSDSEQSKDAGTSADRADVHQWADPENRKVLGRRSWMASASDADNQAIEEAFAAPSPQRYPIDLAVRQMGIEEAKDVVDGCFSGLRRRDPQATGRISVGFDLVANGSIARFADVEILANVDLDDPGFEGCITRRLSRQSFKTDEEGTMHVEYPFLFDLPSPE